MTVRQFPIRQLMNEAHALIPAAANAPFALGTRELFDHRAPPCFVWVPGGGRGARTAAPTREVDEHRTTGAIDLICEVYAKAKTYDQAWVMASNLSKALRDIAQADGNIDATAWVDPSKSHNQNGETLVCTITLATAFDDVWIPLDTLDAPDPTLATLTGVVGQIETTDVLADAGEIALIVTAGS